MVREAKLASLQQQLHYQQKLNTELHAEVRLPGCKYIVYIGRFRSCKGMLSNICILDSLSTQVEIVFYKVLKAAGA